MDTSASSSPQSLLAADTLGQSWHGVRLYPWTHRRDMLYLALTGYAREKFAWLVNAENELELLPLVEAACREKMPEITQEGIDEVVEWGRFAPAAARVLWMAQQTGEVLTEMEPAEMLRQSTQWWEAHLPDEDLREGVRLALRLRTEWRRLVVLPRPEKAQAKGVHAGN